MLVESFIENSLYNSAIKKKVNPNYEVRGIIINKDIPNRIMRIDHDKIEGFMEPMVMNLNVHNNHNELLAGPLWF